MLVLKSCRSRRFSRYIISLYGSFYNLTQIPRIPQIFISLYGWGVNTNYTNSTNIACTANDRVTQKARNRNEPVRLKDLKSRRKRRDCRNACTAKDNLTQKARIPQMFFSLYGWGGEHELHELHEYSLYGWGL